LQRFSAPVAVLHVVALTEEIFQREEAIALVMF
jgi:hypothetical protein